MSSFLLSPTAAIQSGYHTIVSGCTRATKNVFLPTLSGCFDERCGEPCCYCVLENHAATLLVVSSSVNKKKKAPYYASFHPALALVPEDIRFMKSTPNERTRILTQRLRGAIAVPFRPRDLMQVIVGASVLAVPVAFTEETWQLGAQLPLSNVLLLGSISLVFIAFFDYFNFYRYNIRTNYFEYITRVLATYFCSLFLVGLLLTIIQKCNWDTQTVLSLKRTIIVAFPASMSAAISDTIR